MPDIFFFILMLVAGVSVALQPPINASLAARVGVAQSSFISFLVGTLSMAVVMLFRNNGGLKAVTAAPLWELSGGLLGAFYVTSIIVAVPRIGTLAALSAAIATQLAAGMVLDHFGLLGGRHIPMDAWRISGTVLLVIGAGLVLKG